ncbi:MAG: hypothetical protein Q9216_000740 [Gyalolechia sp. 2 TL-2023]
MTHWPLRPALAPGGRYVCITCRLRSPITNLQVWRQKHAVLQHFSTSEQDALAIKFAKQPAQSQEERDKSLPILKRKSKGKSKTNKSKSAAEHNTPEREPGKPSAEARNLQRLLHEKFVAQRRKDALSSQIPEEDSPPGTSRSKPVKAKAQKGNQAAAPKRKSKNAKKKQPRTKITVEPLNRVHGAVQKPPSPGIASDAVSASEKGRKGGETNSTEVSETDENASVSKRKPNLVEKKPHAAEAAMTTKTAVLAKTLCETPVARKNGEEQTEETSSKASTVPRSYASDVKAGMTHSNQSISRNPGVMEQLKSYFRGLKETFAAEGSANQHIPSPIEQGPVQVNSILQQLGLEVTNERLAEISLLKTSKGKEEQGQLKTG